MSQDIMMNIFETTLHLFEPKALANVQKEIIPKMNEVVRRRNSLGILKYRQNDYDLKLVENIYDRGGYVPKMDFITKKEDKGIFLVWKGPFLAVDSRHLLYKMQSRKGSSTTVHHVWLKIYRDCLIPLWLHRYRYELLDLDVAIPFDWTEVCKQTIERLDQ